MAGLVGTDRASRARAVRRFGAVVGGAVAALVVRGVADAAVAELRQPGFGGVAPQDLTAAAVAVASLLGGLLGWVALVAVERATSRGRTLWLGMALAALALSLGGPLSGDGVSMGNRLGLVLLHLAVAVVVIPILYRTSVPARRTRPEGQ